jgi:hypothetical protein
MRGLTLLLLALLGIACASRPATPEPSGWLSVHDDLGFSLIASSRVRELPPVAGYEVRQIVEPLDGATLRIQLTTKVLDERERTAIVRAPDEIGEVWPNALELRSSRLVSHVTDRAWQAIDFSPSGIAHDDFEGGHSTYRTPASVALHVVFIYKATLVVVHASAEVGEPPKDGSDQALIEQWTPLLERVMLRIRRNERAR